MVMPARRSRRFASRWSNRRIHRAYLRFFCCTESGNAEQLKANEPKRLNLYKMTSALIRCFGNIANELELSLIHI